MRRRDALAALAALAAGAATAPVRLRAQPAPALPAVAVWDFDNQSPLPGNGEFLRRALPENLTAQLLRVPGLPVVERHRLRELLAEQQLAASERADAQARLRLGRIVRAARMVFGGFVVLGEQVRVHVRVVEKASSRLLVADEFSGALAGVMQQVEPLNRRLARALGGSVTPGVAYAAAAWEAYDRILELADAGRGDEAVAALQALLARRPDFQPAERLLVALLQKSPRR
ncbi:MAG: hypothetical protein O9343_06295 [Burkholderiaceae bacterium]|jgi:TolB-like protein|nr:CsgG/HfaB family protein [Burkholderiaceae bacterium]MCZ8174787.1 hypothetical protein [Burkholderiaceae bacterium]